MGWLHSTAIAPTCICLLLVLLQVRDRQQLALLQQTVLDSPTVITAARTVAPARGHHPLLHSLLEMVSVNGFMRLHGQARAYPLCPIAVVLQLPSYCRCAVSRLPRMPPPAGRQQICGCFGRTILFKQALAGTVR